jgi:microsomal dipeptidase-like Zn-dependent dipeptidase
MVLALHGTLVDDHQRELSDAQIEKIRQQLKLIQVQMTVRGIAPGTPLALRLFS